MSPSERTLSDDVLERARRVELIVFDVDGVLTDGVISIDDEGVERKNFHVRDGSAIAGWIRMGRQAAILSGRRSRSVDHRARELGITPVLQGNPRKLDGFQEILASTGVATERTCFVGDDLPDLPLFRITGFAACPSDSAEEIKACAHFVSHFPGGRGAVHEIVSVVMKSQNLWLPHVQWYEQRA